MTKPKLLLLVVSLGANAALGAWLLLQPSAPAGSSAPTAIPNAPAAATPTPAPVDPLTQPITLETWPQLAGLSEAAYAQRLKAEGLSPALIRALVQARISAHYTDRLNALVPANKDEYWRRTMPFMGYDSGSGLTPAARRERRAIHREISDAVKAAMGADYDLAAPAEQARRDRIYGALPADTIAQIEAINGDYGEMRSAVNEQTRGVTLPEDRAQLRLLEQEQRADLAAILTPEQLLEYDLRTSPAAARVRNQLSYFEPTEAEFRVLTEQRLAFDRQFGGNHLSEEEQARKRTAEAGLLEQARQVLTPERYADYELVANNDFRNTAMAVGRFNFDTTVAKDVHRLRLDITARTTAIDNQANLTPEQRALEYSALYREASTALTNKLGAEAYTALEQQGGSWLRKLKPRNRPTGGTRP